MGEHAPVNLPTAGAIVGLARIVETELAHVDLTLAQYRVLLYLAVAPTVPSDLASRLAVRRPSVTSLVDGLVERGLVDRQPDDDDRRRVTHSITPRGARLLDKAGALIARRLDAVLAHVSDAEAARARDGLDTWGDALGRAWRARVGAPVEELHG